MSSASTSSSSSPASDESTERKVPKWVPVSAFIGTSLALAIPLLMIRRNRTSSSHTASRVALSSTSAAPPRRKSLNATASLPVSTSSSAAAATSSPHVNLLEKPTESEANPSLMSALSQLTGSSAMLAAKAFAIATALVGVSAYGAIWGVKTSLGVDDARQFGLRMRSILWTLAPSLTSRIHRAPETEEERHALREVLPPSFSSSSPPPPSSSLEPPYVEKPKWSWPEAEKRLQRAYEEGGFPLWAKVAMREVEEEARLERERREREVRIDMEGKP
ncbi:hypothetical protein D9613_008957 [Agrocybe pediades]|uniref:Uncharacterized protein n=1 Tax=Agrocybe pediades TaxID=84607 RepID=A0A8H4QT86_9AGAR|nr:hypothetical protein D9613_008957 [Agrocybe pediades]